MAHQIDLYSWSLELDEAERKRLAALLSSEEIERGERFVFERDRQRYIAGRGRLRQILARHMGAKPQDLVIATAHNGKPYLAHPDAPRFNLSHSAELAAMAISDHFELGIDIEKIGKEEPGSVDQFFSPHEQAALAQYVGEERNRAFFRCWTRKEAFVKARGDGLLMPLEDFDVTLAPNEPARLLRLAGDPQATQATQAPQAPQNWTLLDFTPAKNFAGAIAFANDGQKFILRKQDI